MKWTLVTGLLAGFAVAACGDSNASNAEDPTCVAETLESDAVMDARLGDAGDPANWPSLPPGAIVATTYLRLLGDDAGTQAFDELMGPILQTLLGPADGLMGLSFMSSERCGTVRTLSAWASEEAMMGFVLGDAHLGALGGVTRVSRGGSITMAHDADTLGTIAWVPIVSRFTEHEGSVY